MKYLMVFATLLIFLIVPFLADAGYSVYDRQQVIPEYITVIGTNGPELRKNPGIYPLYPVTFGRKICLAKNIYSADAIDRQEVWEDANGVALSSTLFAACPDIRERKIAEARAAVSAELAKTDYKVIKQAEGVYTLTDAEKTERQVLRMKFNAFESQANTETDFSKLMEMQWEPHQQPPN